MKIEIYDTTLRDGEQTAGVLFTVNDKLAIIDALDGIGCDCIEAGCFMPQSVDTQPGAVFDRIRNMETTADISAFCSTRRPYSSVEDDDSLLRLGYSDIKAATVFGKSWLYQVDAVLRTTPQENISMIRDTVDFLRRKGKRVIFDAEHFFDGYSDNPAYALSVVEAAYDAGADTVVLCDTNGGNLPAVVGMVVSAVHKRFPDLKLGIHCHNDLGLAVAASIEAVISGAVHVQGSVCGIGERCGNADLCTLIPILQLKLGFECVSPEKLANLTPNARLICELANLPFDEQKPFIGGHAFAHKAGTHIDGITKSPKTFEHISPSLVGNERYTLVSGLSGRAAIREKIEQLLPGIDKNSPKVEKVLDVVHRNAVEGYLYDNAEASLMLKMSEALGMRCSFFNLIHYQIIINESAQDGTNQCTAMIKVEVDGETEVTAAEGEGPVNAFDLALRKALTRFYPAIEKMRLTDYRVRVLGSSAATASKVRVFIETTDGAKVWRTIGVSTDIVEASRQALSDSIDYMLSGYTPQEGILPLKVE